MTHGVFLDREQAGTRLAELLEPHWRPPCVVAAIPRGGALVAAPIARRFACPLTLAFVRRISLPVQPELAVGALDEDGHSVADDRIVAALLASGTDLSYARSRGLAELHRLRAELPCTPLALLAPGAMVVLVDDGLATGLTMAAAVAHVRRHRARRIAIAVPCASHDAAERIRHEVHDFVCPCVETRFRAVSRYYDDFRAVTDGEVRAVLAEAAPHSGGPVR